MAAEIFLSFDLFPVLEGLGHQMFWDSFDKHYSLQTLRQLDINSDQQGTSLN